MKMFKREQTEAHIKWIEKIDLMVEQANTISELLVNVGFIQRRLEQDDILDGEMEYWLLSYMFRTADPKMEKLCREKYGD